MAENIKGITIEIEGKTTGLKEALKDVDKSIGSVAAELRKVENQLKFDPSNTVLLAQKQELLSEKIKLTGDKLKYLKDAGKDVEAAIGSDWLSDKELREFQREVIKTESQLKTFDNQLNKTDNESKKVDFKDFSSNLSGLGNKLGSAGSVIGTGVAAGIAAVGAAAVAAGKQLFDMAKNAGEYADEILATAQQTNLSTDTLQKWKYAAEFIDVEVETMTGSMAKMTRSLGSNEEAFGSLGVVTRDAGGNFRTQEEIFMDTIDALGKVENATQRDQIAMQLFGKSAQDLNPLIKAGGDELRRLGEEAIASGNVLSGETLQAYGAFDDTLKRMGKQFEGVQRNIVGAFLPAIESLLGPISEAMGQINVLLSDGLQPGDFDKMIEIASGAVGKVIESLLGMVPSLIQALVSIVTSFWGTIANMIPTLLPVLLDGVFQVITGIVEAIMANIGQLQTMVTTLLTNLGQFLVENLPMILEAAFAILLALVMGIVDALPVLIPQLIQVLLQIVQFILENLPMIIDVAVQIIIALIQGLVAAIPMLVDMLPQIITSLVQTLITLSPMLWEASVQIIMALANGLIQALPQIWAAIPAIWAAIWDGIMSGIDKMQDIGDNIIKGLWEGIKGSLKWLEEKLGELGGWVIDLIKGIFGIKSPSKVMRDEVGLMLGKGLALGIMDSAAMVRGAMTELSSEVNGSFNANINPNASSTVTNKSVAPIFNIQVASGTEADARYLMGMINKELGRMV